MWPIGACIAGKTWCNDKVGEIIAKWRSFAFGRLRFGFWTVNRRFETRRFHAGLVCG